MKEYGSVNKKDMGSSLLSLPTYVYHTDEDSIIVTDTKLDNAIEFNIHGRLMNVGDFIFNEEERVMKDIAGLLDKIKA